MIDAVSFYKLLWVVLVLLYLTPTIVALCQKAESFWLIYGLNVLLGWTGVGWWACLFWAIFGRRVHPSHIRR